MITLCVGSKVITIKADAEYSVPAGQVVQVALSDGRHWYGHGFAHTQPYPLETGSTQNRTFAVNNIQSPIWMCSAGVVLWADTTQSLDVAINRASDGLLQVVCAQDFVLKVFVARNLPEAWIKLMRGVSWRRPTPPADMIGDCWFCTWTQYPRCITQERIIGMAREIRDQKYPCSTLVIDDRWESCFGELTFGPDFSDPHAMVRELHELGFKVVLWVTPFVNQEAATFQALSASGALVRKRAGEGASLLRWWGGTAGLVDLTGAPGRDWFSQRLRVLKNEVGVDGFKIDGGDAKYMPPAAESLWHADPGPSGYSDALLALFEELAPGQCETRTAWMSQRRNIVWRLGGKDSHWGLDNGLKALVTLPLHLSVMGYDLIMPDMVPGRVQTMDAGRALPTDELMVRWTEISALMPVLQFSYFPWNYAEPTAGVVHALARLHKALEGYIVAATADMTAPVLRPLWFAAPEQADLYTIADEFLLGPDLLVCPVMDEGATTRAVTVPPGAWRDAWTGAALVSGSYSDYPARCPGMPMFIRAGSDRLFESVHTILKQIVRGAIPSGITSTHYQCGLNRSVSVTG